MNSKAKLSIVILLFVSLVFSSFIYCDSRAIAKQQVIDLSTAISKVAKGNIPAVVHIDVIQRKEVVNPFYPFENDPFFRYFFAIFSVALKCPASLNKNSGDLARA